VRAIPFLILCVGVSLLLAGDTTNTEGYDIMKVNHEFLDEKGNTHDRIGNLVEKARYQKELEESGRYTGLRFIVHWKAPSSDLRDFTVKVELRGFDAGMGRERLQTLTRDYAEMPGSSGWTNLDLKGNDLKDFGRLMAWKVALLQNGKPMATRKSFTWDDPPPADRKAEGS